VTVQFDTDPMVSIPDTNLRAAMESALNKDSGEVILRSELAGLTTLRANNSGISNLTGLEHATSLTQLFLGRNSISDISAISALSGLTNLNLSLNSISDLTPLSDLTALERLQLRGTDILDIGSLVANIGLSSGDIIDLRGNTLNAAAYDIHIPALQARGVTVQFNDTTGITEVILSDTDLMVDEDSQTSYLVSLASRPSGNVMVMPMSWNTDVAQVSGTLTFTRSDWNQPQRVTVTGINDNIVNDSDRRTTSISHSVSGGGYDNITVEEVTVAVIDTAPEVALRQDLESSSADTAVFRPQAAGGVSEKTRTDQSRGE